MTGDDGRAPPRVSIVLTAHNEAAHIRRTLEEIAAQGEDVEVILVDDRSTDATRAEALAAGLTGLRLLTGAPDPQSPLTTRQQALDLGFRAARGEVILTLDADSRLRPGWIAAMSGPILAGRADAVGGPIAFDGPGWIARWQDCDACYYILVSATMARLRLGGGAMFGNFAFRAAIYRALGGFAALGPALTEDLAFSLALQAGGWRLVFLGAPARVSVHACPDFGTLVRRTLRVTRGPMSPLAAVLTIWPLTLLLAALWALLLPGGGGVLLWRYLAGVAVTGAGILRNGRPARLAFAPFYEPLVLVLAIAAGVARWRGGPIRWGGREYG